MLSTDPLSLQAATCYRMLLPSSLIPVVADFTSVLTWPDGNLMISSIESVELLYEQCMELPSMTRNLDRACNVSVEKGEEEEGECREEEGGARWCDYEGLLLEVAVADVLVVLGRPGELV